MVGALSLVAFGCETEKKTINSNATQENKKVQIDPVVEKQMKENEKNGIWLETSLTKERWQRVKVGFTIL